MKKLLLGLVAAAALTSAPALAADMPLKAPPVPPVLNWSGFYIGGNLGGGWASADWKNNFDSLCPGNAAFAVASCDFPSNSTSFIGGGQLGARWQIGTWVVGLEGTADYAKFNSVGLESSYAAAGILPSVEYQNDANKLSNLYTVTGQVGLAWDRTLWYAKGGLALSSLNRSTQTVVPPVAPFPLIYNTSDSQSASGWTIGTGAEYRPAFWSNVSIGLEYDFIHLAANGVSTCASLNNPGGSAFCGTTGGTVPVLYSGFNANISEVLVRLNYNFNWLARN
jgi:outer membrane immunogenic protein